MAGPAAVERLVARFREHEAALKAGAFKEAQVRLDFLDPLFEALGWDVRNQAGQPEDQRDVRVEGRLLVAGDGDGAGLKAPDYGFYIGRERKFFVEAKKPAVNLREGLSPALQVRRYGWSARLPVSILTDFEELAVYDCRVAPDKADSAAVARIRYWEYGEFLDRWDEIAALFSRDAVRDGALDRLAEATRTQKGTLTVDAAFLREISQWREWLAADLAARNPDLTARDLNYAVQMTINRIVFLRTCEARGIEPVEHLRALLAGERVYPRLVDRFRLADARYNSGLFHFQTERGEHETADAFTPTLDVDDALLRRIIRRLYYPDSPYAFDVIPVEILGQVYEQFFVMVIRLD
jgi:hypothetical protein